MMPDEGTQCPIFPGRLSPFFVKILKWVALPKPHFNLPKGEDLFLRIRKNRINTADSFKTTRLHCLEHSYLKVEYFF